MMLKMSQLAAIKEGGPITPLLPKESTNTSRHRPLERAMRQNRSSLAEGEPSKDFVNPDNFRKGLVESSRRRKGHILSSPGSPVHKGTASSQSWGGKDHL